MRRCASAWTRRAPPNACGNCGQRWFAVWSRGMPLIPDDVIDDIQARADIAELIGRYVPLKRAGRHFKANCPFHKEKTPSFVVNTDKQIFHCFGCGVGGNIFSFLMQQDRLPLPEAGRGVAEGGGVRLPEPERAARGEATDGLAA